MSMSVIGRRVCARAGMPAQKIVSNTAVAAERHGRPVGPVLPVLSIQPFPPYLSRLTSRPTPLPALPDPRDLPALPEPYCCCSVVGLLSFLSSPGAFSQVNGRFVAYF